MGILKLNPVITLEQIRSIFQSAPPKSSGHQRINSLIGQTITDLHNRDFKKAAVQILLLESDLKANSHKYLPTYQAQQVISCCQRLRRMFRETYGVFIPLPSYQNRRLSSQLQPFPPAAVIRDHSSYYKALLAPAGQDWKGGSRKPAVSLDKSKKQPPQAERIPVTAVTGQQLDSADEGSTMVNHNEQLTRSPQKRIINRPRLPRFPSGVNVTVVMTNGDFVCGEWFYEKDGFLKLKLSADSKLHRLGQIVYLNSAQIVSIS